jgi:hypothetical protein
LKWNLWLLVSATTFFVGIGAVNLLTFPRREPVLIEVSARDGGMVCSTENYLELRVYTSGLIEGDVFSGPCMPRFTRFFSSFKRLTSQLDDNQLGELRAVLNQSELSTVKDSYPPFVIQTDSATFQTIAFEHRGKHQNVALVNPNPMNARNIANYPPSLIRLLVEIQSIRQHLDASVK